MDSDVWTQKKYAPFLFCISLSTILFYALFTGQFTIGGTDLLFSHYPNLIFGHRTFQEFGKFALWNPYIFLGSDFSQSMHAHYLNPLYWPFMLLPEENLLFAVTFMHYIMNALIGVVWFRIARCLNLSGCSALLVSAIAQAGMFFWFGMTTLISIPMYLFSSLACWLVLTRNNRSLVSNYFAIIFTLAAIFITPHPGYIIGFSLPIGLVFLITVYAERRLLSSYQYAVVFMISTLTAMILCIHRLLPVLKALIVSGVAISQMKWLGGYANDAYFGLSIFNPIVLGIHLGDAAQIATTFNYGSIHNQFHNALYIGIAPLILIYLAMRAGESRAIILLSFVTFVISCACIKAFEPIYDAVMILFFPYNHDSIFRIISQFSFLFLFIFSVREIPNLDKEKLQKGIRECLIGLGVILLFALAMSGRLMSHEYYNALTKEPLPILIYGCRFVSLLLFAWIGYVSLINISSLTTKWFTGFCTLFIVIASVIAYYLSKKVSIPSHESNILIAVNCLFVLFVCVWVIPFASAKIGRYKTKFIFGISAAIIGFILAQIIIPPHAIHLWPSSLGWIVFIALFFTTLLVLLQWAKSNLSFNEMMLFLLVIVIADLITAYINYTYVNIFSSSPYYESMNSVYPSRDVLNKKFNRKDIYASNQKSLVDNPHLFGDFSLWNAPSNNLESDDYQGTYTFQYTGFDKEININKDTLINAKSRQAAFGVWMKATPGMSIGVFITDPINRVGTELLREKGDGRWHWYTSTIDEKKSIKAIRAHLNISGDGHFSVYAPKLVASSFVLPGGEPDDNSPVVQPQHTVLEKIDRSSYRMNHVTLFNKIAGNELTSGFSMVYETPTYGGVDSDQAQDLVDFVGNFKKLDPSWWARFGMLSVIEDEKALNLLGVGYDFKQGVEIYRPNAIPRFSAFSGYEVQPASEDGLKRLKDDDFLESKTVILDKSPKNLVSQKDNFKKLNYTQIDADKFSLQISKDTPRIVLFNDHFSDSWRALWNGKPLTMYRANTISMAVVLPPGEGELIFDFKPRLYVLLVKVSTLTSAFLLLFAILVFINRKMLHRKNR
ncbi:MAG: hypothetical protein P1U74_00920 [Legionellaceae bacterium]|nr:hypothetical protein [Legionellaceae bacterium]